jgi:hypothetical protein
MVFGGFLIFGGIAGFVQLIFGQGSEQRDAAEAALAGLAFGPVIAYAGYKALQAAELFNRTEYPRLHQEWQNGFICLQCGNRFEL